MSNRKQHTRDTGSHPGTRGRTRRTGDNTALWIGLGSAGVILLILLVFSSGKKAEKQPVQPAPETRTISSKEAAPAETSEKDTETQEEKTDLPSVQRTPVIHKPEIETPAPAVWDSVSGTWTSSQGEMRYTGGTGRGIFLFKKRSWKYCEISVSIKSASGNAGIVFSYSPGKYIIAGLTDTGICEVVTVSGSNESCVQKAECPGPGTDGFTVFKVDTRGKRVMIEINGSLVMQTPIVDSVSEGYAGLMAEHTSSAVFRSFSVKETSTEKCTMCEP